ncbi:PREDICTED: uncharacterized protein LOC107092906 [Cyprinodon variegatus]|uniref:uncharacterized protein LOC107092906 n=1 Tax=Cyprinodon variegatus TaxID=28743 RepID=UPI000742B291|nr:PREDICTED: uncharacterized protein LOC107092906 [Cyprinodon variegatus]
MMTFQILLGVSLVALLLLDVHGLPVKAPKSQQQGGSGTNAASQGVAAPFHAAHASFSAPVGKVPSHPFPVQQPAPFVGMSPMAGVYPGSFPVQAGQYGPYAIPAAYSSDGSQLAGYYAASQQAEAAQPIPTAEWVVAPPSFEEPAADAEVVGALLPPPQPLGPTLQSGETANIVKEAELGLHLPAQQEECLYMGDWRRGEERRNLARRRLVLVHLPTHLLRVTSLMERS